MALPGYLSTATLTFGPYYDLAGNPAYVGMQGKLTLSQPMVDSIGGGTIDPQILVTIGSDGTATAGPVVDNDDPAINQGTAYRMEWLALSYKPTPGNKTFAILRASGSTVDYDTIGNADGTITPGVTPQVPLVTSVNGKSGTVVLTATDVGADASGAAAAVLPSQTGNGGKYLTTNGTAASWGSVASGSTLTPTPTKTGTYTAVVGDLAVMNVPAGGAILNLPAAPADKAQVGFIATGASADTPLTINRGGSDTLGSTGATSVTVPIPGDVTIYQYQASATRWLPVANVKPLSSLDARYLRGGTPTITTTPTFITPSASTNLTLTKGILNQANKYNLNFWMPSAFPAGTNPVTPATNTENDVRPGCAVALGLATAVATGAHDATVTGFTSAAAAAQATRIISGYAAAHISNGGRWGDAVRPPDVGGNGWQSALWATLLGLAGWLNQSFLTTADKSNVARMLVFESSRMLGWKFPYYRDATGTVVFTGDSKTEEVAWDCGPLILALATMPAHTDAPRWMAKLLHMGVASTAAAADVTDTTTVLHGFTPADVLNGSNIEADGTVINHSKVQPDYISSPWETKGGYAAALSMAGMRIPKALHQNAKLMYGALSTVSFANPPFNAPGGTIYKAATGSVYFPSGNDWGSNQAPINFAAMDLRASRYGWDAGLGTTAAAWAQLHLQYVADMQARSTTGQTYTSAGEDTYPGRDQWISMMAADCALSLYAPAAQISNASPSVLLEVARTGTAISVPTAVDVTAPVINSLVARPRDAQVDVSWSGTDNAALTAWSLTRNGTVVYSGTGTSFSDTGLTNGVAAAYVLTATDAAGNVSTSTTTVTPQSGGVEWTMFSDTFTRIDQTGWGNGWVALAAQPNQSSIVSNQGAVAFLSFARTNFLSPPIGPTSADQWTQHTVAVFPAGSTTHPLAFIRATANGSNQITSYYVQWNPTGTSWELYRQVTGTSTKIASLTTTTPAAGYVLRLEADGTNTLRVKVNGSTVITFQDTTAPITTVGVCGIGVRTASSSDNVVRIDNFSCGDLAA